MKTKLQRGRRACLVAAGLLVLGGSGARGQTAGGADWIHVDEAARQVKLDIVAGMTEDNFRWNFNGFAKGGATITVPVGYKVVIEFRNDDPNVPHSIGVGEIQDPFPPMFTDPVPVFAGGISANPTSMTDATMPGESETLAFTAEKEGTYALLCYIPAHAATGMWITLRVAPGGAVSFDPGEAPSS